MNSDTTVLELVNLRDEYNNDTNDDNLIINITQWIDDNDDDSDSNNNDDNNNNNNNNNDCKTKNDNMNNDGNNNINNTENSVIINDVNKNKIDYLQVQNNEQRRPKHSKIIISKLAKLPPPVRRRYTLFKAMGLYKCNEFLFNVIFHSIYDRLMMHLGVILSAIFFVLLILASNTYIKYISSFGLFSNYLFFYFAVIGGFNADVCRILIGTFDFWYITSQVVISLVATCFYVNFDIRCVGLTALHLGCGQITIFIDAWPPASGLIKHARSVTLILLSICQSFWIICVYFNIFSNVNSSTYTIGFVKYDISSVILYAQGVWLIFNIRYAIFTFYYPTSFGMYRHRIVSPTLSRSRKARGSLIVSRLASTNTIESPKGDELKNDEYKAYPLQFDPTSLTQVTIRSSNTICRALFGKQASIKLWKFYKHRLVALYLPIITGLTSFGSVFLSFIWSETFFYAFILPCSIITSTCLFVLILLGNYSLFKEVMKCFSTVYLCVQLLILGICLVDMFNSISAIMVLPVILNGYCAILIDCLPIFNVFYAKLYAFGGAICCLGVIIYTHTELYNIERDRKIPEIRGGDGTYTSSIAIASGISFLAYLLRSIINLQFDPYGCITLTSRIISPLLLNRNDLPEEFVYRQY